MQANSVRKRERELRSGPMMKTILDKVRMRVFSAYACAERGEVRKY